MPTQALVLNVSVCEVPNKVVDCFDDLFPAGFLAHEDDEHTCWFCHFGHLCQFVHHGR